MADAGSVIAKMFGAGDIPVVSMETVYYIRSYAVTVLIAVIGSMPVIKDFFVGLEGRMKGNSAVNVIFTIGEPILLAVLLIMVTGYLVDGSFNPFLYFRF